MRYLTEVLDIQKQIFHPALQGLYTNPFQLQHPCHMQKPYSLQTGLHICAVHSYVSVIPHIKSSCFSREDK